jgi:FixJ family two-component response regulator
MVMPKMTGLELAKKVKVLNASIPIILCTGFKEGITEDVKQYVGIYDILLKPVLARELTEAIQKALEMKTT